MGQALSQGQLIGYQQTGSHHQQEALHLKSKPHSPGSSGQYSAQTQPVDTGRGKVLSNLNHTETTPVTDGSGNKGVTPLRICSLVIENSNPLYICL